MQPKSCNLMPDARRVMELTSFEACLRKSVSWRPTRTVPTRSWPFSYSATRRGISSGGFCRSASIVTTNSPRAAAKPAITAACWPKLRTNETTTTSGFSARASSSCSSVLSREPSSTSTSSKGLPRARSTGSVRAKSVARLASSLKTGTTTERKTDSGSGDTAGLVGLDHVLDRRDHALLLLGREQRVERQRDDPLAGGLRPGQVARPEAVLPAVVGGHVHGREVQAGADAARAEFADERVAVDVQRLELELHDVEVPGVHVLVVRARERPQLGHVRQQPVVVRRELRAHGVEALELLELLAAQEADRKSTRLNSSH